VLCHAGDKVFTIKEVKRCLKPGGVFVFSDLMGADDADEKALR
jgi:SAM-dependent methyltransferase